MIERTALAHERERQTCASVIRLWQVRQVELLCYADPDAIRPTGWARKRPTAKSVDHGDAALL